MKKVEQQPSSCVPKEDSVHNQFQTSSPVSVLESSSSCSGGKTTTGIYIPVPCGRARTKRPRPATFNP
ncbi:GATA transcription factor 8-like, partial [Trifolium medium]|nr:GATA transcription factor 8-like [Trifolium medium]